MTADLRKNALPPTNEAPIGPYFPIYFRDEPLEAPANPGASQDTLNGGDANGDMTIDFGFFAPGSVGDTAFVDLDGDGLQAPGEPGIGGVTVVLLDSNGDTVTVDADGMMITEGTPWRVAASATPCAWLPEEKAITP